MVEQKKGGFVKLCKQRTDRVTRRQDAPLVYSMNASIYFYARDFLKYSKNLMPFTKETAIYVMDDLSGYDIDREIDLKFIEFLLKEEIWKSEV
jgi:CMP-N-acetylneuraminic acid synthetase